MPVAERKQAWVCRSSAGDTLTQKSSHPSRRSVFRGNLARSPHIRRGVKASCASRRCSLSQRALDGRGFLRATDGSLESKLPLAGLRSIPFQSISVFLMIQEGLLFLNDGKITGPAVSGTFSGEVRLADKLSRSVLNIKAILTPGPLLKRKRFGKTICRIAC